MRRKKPLIAAITALGCLALSSAGWAAESVQTVKSDMKLVINGKEVVMESSLVSHHLYAPYEIVAEQLSAEAKWNEEAKSLSLSREGVTIELTEGANNNKAGNMEEPSTAPLYIADGAVMVPVRAVFEIFEYKVVYDEQTRSVSLMSKPEEKEKDKGVNKPQVTILKDLDPEKATGLRIEGIIADEKNRVFTVEMDSKKLYRISADSGETDVLTELPRTGTGMAFDKDGNLYIASGGEEGLIYKIDAQDLEGEPFDTSKIETYISGVKGANGLAFDDKGNLYVTGGATGNIYKVTPGGELSTYESGITPERQEQLIVVNGIAFGQDGNLYVSNTSSGEVNRFTVEEDGSLGAPEQLAKSPLLYGADGLNFGPDGAIYVAANERNAIVRVTLDGKVKEIARNDNEGPLEFPASLYFVGNMLYISNFDLPRGDNAPNEPGIGASIATIDFGSMK
ncbi:SMP-30/gluconolactonase/LRE family protein [Paenibacillus alkalitolerans]|uniref:SMP-30/gluconolactonase/LRE family protein n=1 Tax=Paenibacillus alkalitolerans TaxID=2799335 RepID=UPI0018F4FB0F|nr:SMP-30/gluconolactonase/LRE family protein [Paenibacillus alkalitolerans]